MSKTEISESIKIYIRQRPDVIGLIDQSLVNDVKVSENTSGVTNVSADGKSCTYYSSVSKTQQTFVVDKYFEPVSAQEDLFNTIALPIVESALLGYSGTILAYGPTGSGKTHTMRGLDNEQKGIMPRCIERLLSDQTVTQCEIWASYLQIYCETVTDLLWRADNKEAADPTAPTQLVAYSANQPLMLRDRVANTTAGATAGTAGVYVEGLSRYRVQSSEDLAELLLRGDQNRSTAATNMNETSSRSHAILMLKIITRDDAAGGGALELDNAGESSKINNAYRESTLMLVDLAGSERAAASSGKNPLRLEEAKAINLSLSALGNCMNALATQSQNAEARERSHVPYRDSKLTRLLQGCLGGGARTAVVVTLAPGTDTAGESLSALRFASRASKVKVSAQVTRYKDYESLYRDMKKQLKEFQMSGAAGASPGAGSATDALQNKVKEQESILQQKDRLLDQQGSEIALLKQQLLALQQGGVGTGGLPSGVVVSNAVASSDAGPSEVDWSAKYAALTQSHVTALEAAHRNYSAKLLQSQQKEQEALRDLHAVQLDLKAERERSLQSVRSLREAQDRRNEEESSLKSRISELLTELTTLRDGSEDLERSRDQLRLELQQALQRIQELNAVLADSVSKEQVKEMEGLFIETVTRLSERVNTLEGKRGSEKASGGAVALSGASGKSAGISSANASSSSAGQREVRIEPGGRIRASTKDAPAGAGGYSNGVLNNLAGGMQHSQSTSSVSVAPSGSSNGASGGSKASEPTKGKLW